MRKNRIPLCIIVVIGVLFIIVYAIMLLDIGAKYPLYDCVTYFDKDARFQIVDVGDKYYLYDAKKRETIGTNIKYYASVEESVYFIFETNVEEFGVLDIYTDKFNISTNKLDISKEFSFEKDKMIDLTTKRNDFLKWFSQFIPHKLRVK